MSASFVLKFSLSALYIEMLGGENGGIRIANVFYYVDYK